MAYPKALQYQKRPAPEATHGEDGLLPSRKSASVKKNTKTPGHGMTNQGDTAQASRGKDGLPLEDAHMDESMTGGHPGKSSSGPNSGKSFARKFDASALSQAVRKRSKGGGGYLPGDGGY